jgi:hypothetical protein
MTRQEKQKELKRLWNTMQITKDGISSGFTAWQGQVVAMLAYNPGLQSEFKETVKSVPVDAGYHEWRQYGVKAYTDICNLLSQAINELGLPEEKSARESIKDAGLWEFLTHCSWPTRMALLGFLCGVFIAGFRVGMMDEARTLYVNFMNPHSAQPQTSPTPPQPRK